MGKREDIDGLNSRFADDRFKGFQGEVGLNAYPQNGQIVVIAVDPAGNYDSTDLLPVGAVVEAVTVQVTEAFDAAATILVGTTAVANAYVAAGQISILTTGDKNKSSIGAAVSGAFAVRVTIGGAPTQGSATVTVFYTV
jgi:hypothetical protein